MYGCFCFENLDFETFDIVSCFDIRISDLSIIGHFKKPSKNKAYSSIFPLMALTTLTKLTPETA
jgi:hypothetical protein